MNSSFKLIKDIAKTALPGAGEGRKKNRNVTDQLRGDDHRPQRNDDNHCHDDKVFLESCLCVLPPVRSYCHSKKIDLIAEVNQAILLKVTQ